MVKANILARTSGAYSMGGAGGFGADNPLITV